jgi:hypothetical protein
MACGLGDPTALLGVPGERAGVDALGCEYGQRAGVEWKLGQCSQMLA